MSEHHFYEPRNGHGLLHDPFKAIVAPRPIGWISTVDPEGHVNLAHYSFFNVCSEAPPIMGFSSGGWKASQRNVEATLQVSHGGWVKVSRGGFGHATVDPRVV